MTKLRAFLFAVTLAFAALTQTAHAQAFFHGGAPSPFTTVGWNYGRVASCFVYFDGSTTWFYVYASEGGYGVTNNPTFTSAFASGCQTGKTFSVHVTSLNPFRWDMIGIYPF
jgi:hypothetical protein